MFLLNKLFRNIYNFLFIKHFWVFLLLIVLISYGQMLWMGAWKDDNAIFFKFDHVYENAGFFGKGLLGTGPYKFSITPYYPIYKIFGNQSFIPFYVLILSFYFVSTMCVYYLFTSLFSKSLGKISSFIFAAGYISSEGFFWLANAMLAHVSILLISLTLFFYNSFFKKRKIPYYLFAVLLYWLSAFLVPLRTHFFILIIILFEFIFSAFKKFPKSFFFSIVRLSPFILIFYRYFAMHPDSRALLVKGFVLSIVKGELFRTYNFVTSISNIFISNDLIHSLFKNVPYLSFFAIIFLVIFYFFLFAKKRRKWLLIVGSSVLSLVWLFVSKDIYTSPVLSLSPENYFIAFLGGIILYLLFIFYFLLDRKKKGLYLFLTFWVLVGIVSYSAYEPTAFFSTIHRYFTNSFFALVGVLGLLYLSYPNFGSKVIIIWAVFNLISNFSYLNLVLKVRSFPVANFYKQLRQYLPKIEKGDLLYFDVADDAEGAFKDAFSVSSMPETTAIAWRYGIDRYDFYRAVEFDDLTQTIKDKKVPLNKIYTFFYSPNGLIETSVEMRNLLKAGNNETVFENTATSKDNNLVVDLDKPIRPLLPVELEFDLSASIADPSTLHLPQNPKSPLNLKLTGLAFSYKGFKESFYQKASVVTSSNWQKRIGANLIDNDTNTVWQPDRISWSKGKKESLTLDLKTTQNINKFIWTNGFANNTPTKYVISVSKDVANWQDIKVVSSSDRIESGNLQVVEFSPTSARFIKMTILSTLNNSYDSPGISEVWVVPAEYTSLDVNGAEKFLKDPFSYVADATAFKKALQEANYTGSIKVSWFGNKSTTWATQPNSEINVIYDGVRRSYKMVVPAGGTEISKIKLFNMEIPGKVAVSKIKAKWLNDF